MKFIHPSLEVVVKELRKLSSEDKPRWGVMSAQRMVEHLTDTLILATGNHSHKLAIPEERVQRAQQFIDSEHPMPKDFQVSFATPEINLRNDSIDAAITEFKDAWHSFETFFSNNNGTTLHPYFGQLNFDQWLRLHSKHVTHHLLQFGVHE